MPNINSYHLFVSNKCSCCDKILDYLKNEDISIKTTNIDEEEYHLPFSLMILPALMKETKLIGYGYEDIISSIKNN
jgi:arsenate reductase-like glutaredoxin family protein